MSIWSRVGTIIYEIGKTVILKTPQYNDYKEEEFFIKHCEKNICTYCQKSLSTKKSKKKGDHINCVIKDKKIRELSNFAGVCIPCCTDCNSSKGGKDLEDFLKISPNYDKEFIGKILDHINKNKQIYIYDVSFYDKICEAVSLFLKIVQIFGDNIYIAKEGDKIKNDNRRTQNIQLVDNIINFLNNILEDVIKNNPDTNLQNITKKSNSISVQKIDLITNEIIEEFNSLAAVDRKYKITNDKLKKVIKNKETFQGFRWKYKN